MNTEKLLLAGVAVFAVGPLLTLILIAIVLKILGIASISYQTAVILECVIGVEAVIGVYLMIAANVFEDMCNNSKK